MKAIVTVRLKAGVLDPQGQATGNALRGLGFTGVGEVRQGKVIEIDLADGDPEAARVEVDRMARTLLANPVVETWSIDIRG
ncbi:MAG: phosphoribosylformylglycinamidine synthase subunit PurS [Alphaproteobacteria bacterium]|nr:phosphoribosylformylglycinamidine synthase subunit PurS [Alphaproteobacteria bacterium]TAD88939.1 MAG: phosphoribosylformylglycinamidine synthase subunit PurS [Alphaproteobacteria bacterium]